MSDAQNLFDFVNNPVNPTTYLSIDPGKSNGVCGYDVKCYLQFMYTVQAEDMVKFLDTFHKVQTCIIENYKLYPNKIKQQIYSDVLTSRVIGRVESWATGRGVTLFDQGSYV